MAESALSQLRGSTSSMDKPPEYTVTHESSSILSEDQFQCSICLDVFTDPVSTSCGHNFCRSCLTQCWNLSPQCHCPLCKEKFTKRPELKINTTLREVADHFKKKSQVDKAEVLCDACTGEKQKALRSCLDCGLMFCKSHLKPHHNVLKLRKHKLINPVKNLEDYICQKHEKPYIIPIEEEIDNKKTQLGQTQTEVQQMIQDRLKNIKEINHSVELSKLQKTLDKKLSKTLDEMLRETVSTELKRIQQYAVDMTLNPKTAHPNLILSDDGKQVKHGNKKKKLLNTSKRFTRYIFILGKQSFSSGRFYYEVQVGGKAEWNLGVARKSVNRKDEIILRPQDGFWTVVMRNGDDYEAGASPPVPLSLKEKPQKVGVFVDYEEGQVSFYDVENRVHIYSYTGQMFTEKLYPYFCPCLNDGGRNAAPLIITPVIKT
ncbi:E3 ubiquitin-protein ligase TRIM39-like [Trichomycterus rosablanca]|uniref:E3 ubiquitin-protein ligase TRIM39-like n=1 Tax=Trichomycterus rosablanca TaxID=2290929 RepID=UPI002F35E92C